jgi:hypothetical protein
MSEYHICSLCLQKIGGVNELETELKSLRKMVQALEFYGYHIDDAGEGTMYIDRDDRLKKVVEADK